MKVAILHITRIKVKPDQHALLVETSGSVFTKYAQKALAVSSDIEIKNFFINSGDDWQQMRKLIEGIQSKKPDAFLLWMTPGVVKMPLFSKDLVSFVSENIKRPPMANLFYQEGHMSFLSAGINPSRYGTKVDVPEAVNI